MLLIENLKKLQVIRFIAVGAGCAAVEFLIFHLSIAYSPIGHLQANLVSLLIAVLLNYFLSQKLVFKKGKYSFRLELTAFVATSMLGVLLNQYAFWFFSQQAELQLSIAKVLAIGSAATFNYVSKKYIVFRG